MIFNTGAALLDAIVLAVVSRDAEGTYGYKITQDVRQIIECSESTLYPVLRRLQKDENMTVFLTTHYMEEASNADNVIILDHGRIAAEGTPLELKNKYTGDYITLYNVSVDEVKTLGRDFEEIKDAFKVFVKNTKEATELITKHPEIFRDYEITKGGMDDVFLAVTGRKLGGDEQ